MDAATIVERKHPLAACEVCPLADQPIAPTTGPTDAAIAIVSRSPGYHEAQAGKPFSGPSGRLLDHLLKENGVSRDECITTNVVLCYTDKPPKEAMAACRPRLDSEIQNARKLILCGAEASAAFTGLSVNKGRGHIHDVRGRLAVVTNNPAAAIRDDSVYPNLVRDFNRILNPTEPRPFPEVRWTDDEREALEWIRRLSTSYEFAVDIESTGLEYDSRLVSIGIGRDAKAVVFGRNVVNAYRVVEALGRLLSDPHKTYIYHNGKYDVKVLRSNGINARVDEDSLLLSYVLDERPGQHDLDYLTADRLGWPDYTPTVVEEGKKKQHWIGREDELQEYGLTWDDYAKLLYEYNGRDTSGTFLLHTELSRDVASEGASLRPYQALLIPASNALADIEAYGVAFDSDLAQWSLDHEVKPELEQLLKQAKQITGRDINLNSPKQVSEYLYDTLQLKHTLKRRGKERSVDAAVRKEILENRAEFMVIPFSEAGEISSEQLGLLDDTGDEFTKVLDRFKKLDKVRSTYIEALIKLAQSDGRIHGVFSLHTTETGRLSGRSPNLQNQPRPTSGERLPNVRSFYKASDGHVLIQADYSQAELRVAAVLSGDKNLQEIYYNDLDLHSEIATDFYGPTFTKEQRTRAKTINFGILYGQEAKSFAAQMVIPINEADRLIRAWWRRFPDVRKFVKQTHKKILTEGTLESVVGRRRRFHLITDENRHHTLKEGVNFVVSSPASDLCLYSLIKLHEVPFLNILLTVHDSILFETKPEHLQASMSIIKETMESAASDLLGWSFPFVADLQVGERWGDLHDV